MPNGNAATKPCDGTHLLTNQPAFVLRVVMPVQPRSIPSMREIYDQNQLDDNKQK